MNSLERDINTNINQSERDRREQKMEIQIEKRKKAMGRGGGVECEREIERKREKWIPFEIPCHHRRAYMLVLAWLTHVKSKHQKNKQKAKQHRFHHIDDVVFLRSYCV